ncbi:MAG: hypothetical protein DMF63_08725 [Acidobacteria bacterium]|nr:MAG: hypothetical protein DMF63_08725 [Acidobacteriota bacterium]
MKSKTFFSNFGVLLETISVAGLLAQTILVLGAWAILPSIIPVHFDLAGNPDSHGPKSDLILLFALSLTSYVGLTWLGRFSDKFNYPWTITEGNAQYQYALATIFVKWIKTQLILLFAFLTWSTISISTDKSTGLGLYFVPLILTLSGASLVVYIFLASRR